jgi:pimeloyl-ACP methyl ester carboxylesterase
MLATVQVQFSNCPAPHPSALTGPVTLPRLRIPADGIDLEYEQRGAGEPVVLIHGGVFPASFAILLDEEALTARHKLIRYHRAGYAGSGGVHGPLGVDRQAAHCLALMDGLGVERAHVVGHSSGGNIALQVALARPAAVRTLTLLEPALLAVPSGPFAGEAMGLYRDGDAAAAVDVWMRGVAGPHYRDAFERLAPGSFAQAVTDADTFFGQELPAVRAWEFGADDAKAVTQPTLVVLGGRSAEIGPAYGERHRLLLEWLPRAEPYVLPGATHLMHVHNPGDLASRLADFITRATG